LVGGATAFVPPHPIAALINVAIVSRLNCVIVLRRGMGNPKNSSDAMAIRVPPAAATRGGYCVRAALWVAADVAVVLIVSVAVTAASPVIGGGTVTEHVGASAPPVGPPATAQLRATLPVKPPLGLIVTVEVPFGPGAAMVIPALLSVKPGGAAGTLAGTLTVKLVVALRPPAEVPVTVTV
jgi:hypothetical protein